MREEKNTHRVSHAPEVEFKDYHPWGKLPKKSNVAGEAKPYDPLPEGAWVACRWCGFRVNMARHDKCPHCESDNYT
jgi:rubrerythrin